MNVREAASALGCSRALVYKLCERHQLGHHRIGFGRGMIVVSPEQLEAYLRATEVFPAPEGTTEPTLRRRRGAGIPDVLGEIRAKRIRLNRSHRP
jgi:excisionase family DNA binding protein